MVSEQENEKPDECHIVADGTKLDVTRFFHTNTYLEELFSANRKSDKSWKQRLPTCKISRENVVSSLLSLFPLFNVIRTYRIREYIIGDLLSGLSVGCLHLPKGIAFGMLAALAPAYGLYTSFFPLIIYTIFGTSPHVSFATNAVIAILIAEIVESSPILSQLSPGINVTVFDNDTADYPLFDEELQFKASVSAGISLFVGIILLLMGVMRLGFLTTYFSTSFIGGFTTAAAFHIATSQIPRAFGFKIPRFIGIGKLIHIYEAILTGIPQTNVASIIIFFGSLLILMFIKEYINEKFKHNMKIPIPIDLIMIIVVTTVSHFGEFQRRYDVRIVGTIPSGIPSPALPHIDSIPLVISESFIIAVLIFSMTISIAELCAKRHGYEIDENQELIAYGLCNFISSFFFCFPSCVGPPRSMVLSEMGVKTTVNNLISALFILLVLMVLGRLFVSLPVPLLASMIIVAVTKLLLQATDLRKFWKMNKYDFATWIITFLTGVLMDLPYGLLFGIVTSFVTVILQSQRSNSYAMGKVGTEDIYVSIAHYDKIREIPGVKIFRMESSLYFATAALFRKRLYLSTLNPKEILQEKVKENSLEKKCNKIDNEKIVEINHAVTCPIFDDENDKQLDSHKRDATNIRFIIIDCIAINYVDYEGVEMLSHVIDELHSVNVTVYLARCNAQILKSLHDADFHDNFPKHHIFVDIPDALAAAVASIKTRHHDNKELE